MKNGEKINVEFKIDDIFMDPKDVNYYLNSNNACEFFMWVFRLKVVFHIIAIFYVISL